MKTEFVKNWMTRDVISITPDALLPDVGQLMANKRIRHLPVMDQGHLVGIITWGDVREAEPSPAELLEEWELDYILTKVKIRQIMTRKPLTINQEATIVEAAGLMLSQKIGGLPVVDDSGQVVGMFTESDMLRTVAEMQS